jgi:hypothetical protein
MMRVAQIPRTTDPLIFIDTVIDRMLDRGTFEINAATVTSRPKVERHGVAEAG